MTALLESREAPAESQAPRRTLDKAALVQALALPGAWLIVIGVFGALRPATYLTTDNFATIFGTQAPLVILALAVLIPITAGDYDLSTASVLTLSSMLVAILNVQHHWAIVPAVLAALGAGAFTGAVNGAFVVLFGVDPFIVTLGSATFVQGVVLWISSSATISGVSERLVSVVSGTSLLGIPLGFYYGLALCAAIFYLVQYTPLGRRLVFVGQDRTVSRLSGIRVRHLRFGALVASGLLAALAGVVYTGITGGADPTSGTNFLLPAFAAVFLGATGIQPGRFNAWGSLVAVYFLASGINGLQLLGVQSYVQQLFFGGALVVAVTVSQLAQRHRATET